MKNILPILLTLGLAYLVFKPKKQTVFRVIETPDTTPTDPDNSKS